MEGFAGDLQKFGESLDKVLDALADAVGEVPVTDTLMATSISMLVLLETGTEIMKLRATVAKALETLESKEVAN